MFVYNKQKGQRDKEFEELKHRIDNAETSRN